MTTGNDNGDGEVKDEGSAPGTGPGQFSEEEIAAVTAGPKGDPELEELEAATIDVDDAPDLESSFEKIQSKAKKLSPERIRAVIQSVLFVAAEPQSIDQIYESTGIDREQIAKALEKLSGVHREGVSGIVLYEVGGGWQFRTDPGSGEFVRRFLRVKPQRLTRAAVETLAIIAYRQPVTRPEIEDIRGVDSGAVLKALLDRKLIKILGKKEEVGRPILYGTTKEFLEYFALKDLSALPTLREFHELSEESQEIVEKETGGKPAISGTIAELADNGEFQRKIEEAEAKSQEALEELEKAIEGADTSSKATNAFLNPPPPPAPEGAQPAETAAPAKPEP